MFCFFFLNPPSFCFILRKMLHVWQQLCSEEATLIVWVIKSSVKVFIVLLIALNL